MRAALVWILALFLGAAIPALLFALARGEIWLFPPAFLITLSHAVILGLPSTVVYRRSGMTRARWALLGGFAIGALPSAIFLWRTFTNWSEAVQLIGGLGCLGAIGAFAGWLVFRLTTGSLQAR